MRPNRPDMESVSASERMVQRPPGLERASARLGGGRARRIVPALRARRADATRDDRVPGLERKAGRLLTRSRIGAART